MIANIRTNTVRKSILDAAIGALSLTALLNITDPDGPRPNSTVSQTRHVVIQTLLMIASDLPVELRNVLMDVDQALYRVNDYELIDLLTAAKKKYGEQLG